MFKISKNLILGGIIAAAIGIAVLLWLFLGQGKSAALSSVETKIGDITETISLTGQVKASQGVDLAFETQGKIIANYVKVGDKIYAGRPLVAIDSSTLQAQLEQAQAQLDALNIDTVKSKTDVALQSLYANSLSAVQKSVTTAKDILLTFSDIQYNHFVDQTQQAIKLQTVKARAVYSLLGQSDAGFLTSEAISQLNGGAYGLVQNAVNSPTQENIDTALSGAEAALQDVNNFINAFPINPSFTSTERASISLAKTNINLEIITTSANMQAIASLKVNNSATISTTDAQIQAAQASVNAIKTQISKTVLRALFNGQVDKDNVIVGSIIPPNTPVITISNNSLEIDTYIPEIDIANAKIGASANITLDAYGNGVILPATIISVDLAQSMINGIPVYGAKLKFNNPDDTTHGVPQLGMTANITIISDTHSNVLIIPESAVIQNSDKYFVVVDKGNFVKEKREVTVGLRDGKNIEIASGLKLGEKIFGY